MRLIVEDLDPEGRREQRPALEDVVPRHARASKCLGADKPGELATEEIDAPHSRLRQRRLAELTTLEDDVLEGRAVEVTLGHAAVAEHDPFELREAQAGKVEPAVGE